MFEAMDKAALAMIAVIENDTEVDGKPQVSMSQRMEAFAMCERWMNRRAKSQPDKTGDEGVSLLRQMISDPKEVVARLKDDPEFHSELERIGWLRPPEKLKGRPTTAQAEHRAAYEAARTDRYGESPPDPDAAAAAGWDQFGIGDSSNA